MSDTGISPSDRVVVVTGAASGIGRATAEAFAAHSAQVVALDIDAVGLRAHDGSLIRTRVADIRQPNQVTDALRDLDRIDVVVNAAGRYAAAGLAASEADLVTDLFAVNVLGTTVLTQIALPRLAASEGVIVNVSSTLGDRPSRSASAYAASKAALEQITRCWALELAPRRIRVNAVAPGPVETPMLARSGLTPDAVAEQRRTERDRIPLHRLGRPAEVAEWIVRLAAPGEWVTGQILHVDGGLRCA